MKRIRIIIALYLVFMVAPYAIMGFSLFGNNLFKGNSNDYARITELDYKAEVVDEVDSNGKVIITERLTFDIHAASNETLDDLFWELWRELPEEYVDGVKVEYNVLSVKQIYDDGSEFVYEESPKLYWSDSDFTDSSGKYGPGKWFHSEGPYDDYYNYESLIFYVDGLYRETVVFEIQYEMFNASLRYNDYSELYLALYYGETINYLTSVKGQILVPTQLMAREGNYGAYTYGTNSHEFDFIESDTVNPGYHSFIFELDETQLNFKSYNNYLEFALLTFGEDKHIFTQNASINYHYNDDMLAKALKAQKDYEKLPADALRNKTTALVGCVIGSLLILGLAYSINKSYKKKNNFFKPSQEFEFFRDIPSDLDANFARKLVFIYKKKDDAVGDGYSAAMLSLVYKNYIDVIQIDPTKKMSSSNIKITVKEAHWDIKPLSPIEERYLNLIKRHVVGNEITLDTFQNKISKDYEYTNTFVNSIKSAITNIGVSTGFFQKANYNQPKNSMKSISTTFIVLGILIMIIPNAILFNTRMGLSFGAFFILGISFIISAIYLRIVSRKYLLLTQLGQDEYAKWRALYNFLNNETLMVERGVQDLVLWEKYLIYATAFGISEKVINALKISVPEHVLSSSPILHNNLFRTRMFYTSSHSSFSRATRTATFTSRSGGHGGFGGGGRGGGGGGGGH